MAGKRQQAHHYYSVFIAYPYPAEPELAYFGFNERQASWEFYKAIKAAEHKPGARAVDLRCDGTPVASVDVSVKTMAAIA